MNTNIHNVIYSRYNFKVHIYYHLSVLKMTKMYEQISTKPRYNTRYKRPLNNYMDCVNYLKAIPHSEIEIVIVH